MSRCTPLYSPARTRQRHRSRSSAILPPRARGSRPRRRSRQVSVTVRVRRTRRHPQRRRIAGPALDHPGRPEPAASCRYPHRARRLTDEIAFFESARVLSQPLPRNRRGRRIRRPVRATRPSPSRRARRSTRTQPFTTRSSPVSPPGRRRWNRSAVSVGLGRQWGEFEFMVHLAFTEGDTEWGEHLTRQRIPFLRLTTCPPRRASCSAN